MKECRTNRCTGPRTRLMRIPRGVLKAGMGTGGPGAARAMLESNADTEEWRTDSDVSRCCPICINPRA